MTNLLYEKRGRKAPLFMCKSTLHYAVRRQQFATSYGGMMLTALPAPVSPVVPALPVNAGAADFVAPELPLVVPALPVNTGADAAVLPDVTNHLV